MIATARKVSRAFRIEANLTSFQVSYNKLTTKFGHILEIRDLQAWHANVFIMAA